MARLMCWYHFRNTTQPPLMGHHDQCSSTPDGPDMSLDISSWVNWRRGLSIWHTSTIPIENRPIHIGYNSLIAHATQICLKRSQAAFPDCKYNSPISRSCRDYSNTWYSITSAVHTTSIFILVKPQISSKYNTLKSQYESKKLILQTLSEVLHCTWWTTGRSRSWGEGM